jgi:hypothetical protein
MCLTEVSLSRAVRIDSFLQFLLRVYFLQCYGLTAK